MEQVHFLFEDDSCALSAKVESSLLKKVRKILANLEVPDGYLSVFICSKQTMRSMNLQYRNIDAPTDILSWNYYNDSPGDLSERRLWGEMALCLEVVQKQAQAAGWDLTTELLRLIVHGLVHLQGFDHETAADEIEMIRREAEILSMIGLDDIYDS